MSGVGIKKRAKAPLLISDGRAYKRFGYLKTSGDDEADQE